ncbi:hypothetical protein H2248_010921 [Termitomyces sp. 'cryptogamus']|nr:hypothetical protein H2248_010921 [Termitomyces sp. 'cryptogamus']
MPKSPLHCKPCEKPQPYAHKPRAPSKKGAPKTSAKPAQKKHHDNLTLHDWLTVFIFVDEHPTLSQSDICDHFGSKLDGALVFSQAALSRKLKNREEMEARVNDNPNVLSSKHPHAVTRPDVEWAFFLWVKHIEEKQETVNGPMLKEKQKHFEKNFNVPENECITGNGWIPSFCQAYKIKEYWWHGEADSVDLEAVEAEQQCVKKTADAYKEKYRFNIDETSLFAM